MPKTTPNPTKSKYCIDGLYRKGTTEYVGYCWCKKHKGFLTRKLMKKHECPSKGCHYFQKFEDAPYWKDKAEKKQAKKDRVAGERAREAREALILEMARDWTNHLPSMDFTSGKQPTPEKLILTYFANRFVNLTRCKKYMSKVWGCDVELRCIKPDADMRARFLEQKRRRLAS